MPPFPLVSPALIERSAADPALPLPHRHHHLRALRQSGAALCRGPTPLLLACSLIAAANEAAAAPASKAVAGVKSPVVVAVAAEKAAAAAAAKAAVALRCRSQTCLRKKRRQGRELKSHGHLVTPVLFVWETASERVLFVWETASERVLFVWEKASERVQH